jgi:hypothetical protein
VALARQQEVLSAIVDIAVGRDLEPISKLRHLALKQVVVAAQRARMMGDCSIELQAALDRLEEVEAELDMARLRRLRGER